MATTYSTNLALSLIATGELAGTWGTVTNTNLGTLIEQAISGYTTQAITDGADTTLTMSNGASSVARNMYIEMTGTLTAARNLIVPANKKLYFIYNNTSGGYAVTVKVLGQTGVSVPAGAKVVLVSNGTDIIDATNYMSAITVGGAVLPGSNDGGALGASGTAWSDLFLASGAVINFAAGDAVLTHSTGILTVSTGDLRVTTAGTNTASAVTVGGTQTLTAKTLTAPVLGGTVTGTYSLAGTPTINVATAVGGTWTAAATWTLPALTLGGTVTSNGQSFSGTIADLGTVTTVDINGGTIDGAVIGGAATAAGSFTTITGSGILSVTDATDATSATAASLKTAGGIAAVKALWIGATSRLVGAVTMDSALTVATTITATGNITSTGGLILGENVGGNDVEFRANAPSAKYAQYTFYVNDVLKWNIYNEHTTDALHFGTGSGSQANLTSGGNLALGGTLTVSGNASIAGATLNDGGLAVASLLHSQSYTARASYSANYETPGVFGSVNTASASIAANKVYAGVFGVARTENNAGSPGSGNITAGLYGLASNAYGGGVNAYGVYSEGAGHFTGAVTMDSTLTVSGATVTHSAAVATDVIQSSTTDTPSVMRLLHTSLNANATAGQIQFNVSDATTILSQIAGKIGSTSANGSMVLSVRSSSSLTDVVTLGSDLSTTLAGTLVAKGGGTDATGGSTTAEFQQGSAGYSALILNHTASPVATDYLIRGWSGVFGASAVEKFYVTNTGAGLFAGTLTVGPANAAAKMDVGTTGLTQSNYGLAAVGGLTGGMVKFAVNTTLAGQIYGNAGGMSIDTTAALPLQIFTNGVEQVRITHTASADRYISLTGSNGGNPTIATSAGSLAITPAVVMASTLTVNDSLSLGVNDTGGNPLYINSDNANGGYGSWSLSDSIVCYFGAAKQLSGGLANNNWGIDVRGGGIFYLLSNGAIVSTQTSTGLTLAGTLTTSAPTGGAGAWELGVANAVSPSSPNRTITVEIGGTAYYIHAKTTND